MFTTGTIAETLTVDLDPSLYADVLVTCGGWVGKLTRIADGREDRLVLCASSTTQTTATVGDLLDMIATDGDDDIAEDTPVTVRIGMLEYRIFAFADAGDSLIVTLHHPAI